MPVWLKLQMSDLLYCRYGGRDDTHYYCRRDRIDAALALDGHLVTSQAFVWVVDVPKVVPFE